jgi:hypothetical protein
VHDLLAKSLTRVTRSCSLLHPDALARHGRAVQLGGGVSLAGLGSGEQLCDAADTEVQCVGITALVVHSLTRQLAQSTTASLARSSPSRARRTRATLRLS